MSNKNVQDYDIKETSIIDIFKDKMISGDKVWFDNKVVTFIKESKECGGMSIIEIDGVKTHAVTKALFTLDKIFTMFNINQPTLDKFKLNDIQEDFNNLGNLKINDTFQLKDNIGYKRLKTKIIGDEKNE